MVPPWCLETAVELVDEQRQGALVRAHSGVGLGLAIVKSHVDNLQGELRFDSREGEGTTVTVWFPAACRVPQ